MSDYTICGICLERVKVKGDHGCELISGLKKKIDQALHAIQVDIEDRYIRQEKRLNELEESIRLTDESINETDENLDDTNNNIDYIYKRLAALLKPNFAPQWLDPSKIQHPMDCARYLNYSDKNSAKYWHEEAVKLQKEIKILNELHKEFDNLYARQTQRVGELGRALHDLSEENNKLKKQIEGMITLKASSNFKHGSCCDD